MGFSQGSVEQIGDLKFVSPLVQIGQVERAGSSFHHAQNVAPLAIRDFAAQPIPFELREDGVFGAGYINALFGVAGNDRSRTPL